MASIDRATSSPLRQIWMKRQSGNILRINGSRKLLIGSFSTRMGRRDFRSSTAKNKDWSLNRACYHSQAVNRAQPEQDACSQLWAAALGYVWSGRLLHT